MAGGCTSSFTGVPKALVRPYHRTVVEKAILSLNGKKTSFALSLALALALLLGGIVLYLLAPGPPETTGEPGPEASSGVEQASAPEPGDPDVAGDLEQEPESLLVALARAVDRNDAAAVRRLAQQTRDWLEEDPGRTDLVRGLLVDVDLDRGLRITLAWVLGSLDSELATRSLLAALAASASDATALRWLVYALGVWNGELTRENRFDFSLESPWVVEAPTGLRVPIACYIDDEDTISALVPFLAHEDFELRRAAIASSRHSLSVDRLRDAFRRLLAGESEVGNQAEVAEALAGWARRSGVSSPETATVVAEIIDEAQVPDRDLLRLKVQPDLRGVAMEPAHIEGLQRVASGNDGDEFAVRQFALEIVGSQIANLERSQSWKFGKQEIHDLLLDMITSDPESKLRETAVRQLVGIPGDVSARALVDALHGDTAWNVRFAAARELGTLRSDSSAALVRTALKDAMVNDQDSRVRQVAQRSLKSKLPSAD
jgi:HEAT repeat protein